MNQSIAISASRRTRKGLAAAAIAALGFSTVGVLATAAPAGAATRTVCASGCQYTSIAAAAAAAVNGDVITVAAGTYNEPAVLISQKGITLQGAGSATTIIDGGDAITPGTSGQISVQSAAAASGNITISGFTVRNPVRTTATGSGYGMFLKASRANPSAISVSDMVIEGEDYASGTNYPLYLSGATGVAEPTTTLDDVQITQADGNAVLLENYRSSVTITNSTIPEATNGAPALVSFNSDARAERNTGTYTVDGNTFVGSGATFYSFGASDQGTDNIVVTDNDFTQLTGGGAGVALSNIGSPGFPTTATITGNTFSGTKGGGTVNRGITLGARTNNPLGDVTIANNSITGIDQAIGLSGTPIGTVTVEGNRLPGNTTGLSNTSATGVVNASANWWGCNDPSGPAPCSVVTGTGTTNQLSWVVADATLGASSVTTGGTTSVDSSLDELDDGSPFVPGTAFADAGVTYSAVAGTVVPGSGSVATGVGPSATYTAPNGVGTDTVTANVDGFPIALPISVTSATTGVSGVVTNADNGQPIAGLQVRLYSGPGYTTSAATTTNALGGYSFTKPAGDYKVWFRDVSNAQWVSEYYDDQATLAAADVVTVTSGSTVANGALAPKVTPPPVTKTSISGTVTSTLGGPISGIQVRLYSAADGYSSSAATTTNASGQYTFANRAAGSYKIWFRDLTGNTYVSEYYNDQPDLASATVIPVAGTPVTVDASLAPAGGGGPTAPQTISGTVTDGDLNPIAGIQVRLYSAADGYAKSTATTTDEFGNYSFPNRQPGTYKVWFRSINGAWVSEYYDDAPSLATANELVVANDPVIADGVLAPPA